MSKKVKNICPKWVQKKTPDEFLSECLVGNDVPYEWVLNLSIRGVDAEDAITEHNAILAKFCRYIEPRHIFEIGTGNGKIATICGLNSDALITTLEHESLKKSPEHGGLYIMNEIQDQVRQSYFDFSLNMRTLYSGRQIDMVVINISGSTQILNRITDPVFDYVREDGVILWNNFFEKSVMDSVHHTVRSRKIHARWIRDTEWAGALR